MKLLKFNRHRNLYQRIRNLERRYDHIRSEILMMRQASSMVSDDIDRTIERLHRSSRTLLSLSLAERERIQKNITSIRRNHEH